MPYSALFWFQRDTRAWAYLGVYMIYLSNWRVIYPFSLDEGFLDTPSYNVFELGTCSTGPAALPLGSVSDTC